MADATRARFDRILVPIDFSRETDEATRAALALAAHGQVHLMHVADGDEGDSAARLREVAQRVAGDNDMGVELHVAVEPGPRVSAIVDYAQQHDVDLLIMASKGGSLLTGGITEQVAMQCPCPVLVCRGQDVSLDAEQPVVVAVDGAASSKAALEIARRLAPDDEIQVVHVARGTETEAQKEELVTAVGPVARVHFVDGEPAPEIMGLVREVGARMLIVTIHAEPDRHPLEVGRVGRRLIHGSSVPVVVTHA